jgi:hypothetical protein
VEPMIQNLIHPLKPCFSLKDLVASLYFDEL